jgi:regulator of protease activity HflC (stomatin/prohibitin superfamily)
MRNNQGVFVGVVLAIVIVLLIALFFMFGYPLLNVWQQEMHGKAELKRAEGNRQILIQEAEAKKQASKALAEAEVERARGVAEANRIIGGSLHDNENYLRYLWIHNLEAGGNQVIYVPTEAGLPILESGKRLDAAVKNP